MLLVLRCLLLANMFMESMVNLFEGSEAKAYEDDPDILVMTNLISAYRQNDRLEFEEILKSNQETIMNDDFIQSYIEDLVKNIRTQELLKMIESEPRIIIPSISEELNVPEKEIEQLLESLILDNKIQGHIDPINKLLDRSDFH